MDERHKWWRKSYRTYVCAFVGKDWQNLGIQKIDWNVGRIQRTRTQGKDEDQNTTIDEDYTKEKISMKGQEQYMRKDLRIYRYMSLHIYEREVMTKVICIAIDKQMKN